MNISVNNSLPEYGVVCFVQEVFKTEDGKKRKQPNVAYLEQFEGQNVWRQLETYNPLKVVSFVPVSNIFGKNKKE